MARKSDIRIRRSAVSGAVPTTSDLNLGELALNTYDGKLYAKKSVGGTESIVELSGGGTAQNTIWTEFIYSVSSNGTTTFSGSDDNGNSLSYLTGAIQVFVNGVLLDPNTDYTATSGNSVVLTTGANSGDHVQIATFSKLFAAGDAAHNNFSGNGSTTQFTLGANPGDENNTNVFIDGVYQNKSTYSVTGTTLTFSTAPANGTSIDVMIGTRNVSLGNVADLSLGGNLSVAGSATLSGLSAQNSESTALVINGSDVVGTRELGALAFAANSDAITEGSSNLFFTNERVDDRVDALLQAGTGITLTYNDSAGTLTIAGSAQYGDSDVESYLDSSGITLPDSVKAQFGSSNDLQIYHDGSNSYIDEAGTGSFNIRTDGLGISFVHTGGSVNMAQMTQYGVTLNYNGSTRLTTNSGGASVTGNLVASGNLEAGSSNFLRFAAGTSTAPSILFGDSSGTGGALSFKRNSDNAVAMSIEADGDVSIQKDLTVTGNLTVQGTTVTLNTATLDVEDKNITLNKGSGDTSSTADGAGITIQDAVNATTDASILWDASNDEFDFSHAINTAGILKVSSYDTELASGHLRFKFNGGAYIDNNTTGQSLNFRVSNSSSLDTTALTINSTGQLLATPLGVSTPSFAFTNDSNTGMTRPTSDQLQLVTGGTEAVRIDDSGNVGIGISSPTTRLHVAGSGGDAELILQRTGAQASSWGLKPYNSDFFIRENGTDRVTIKAGGSVGIGSTTPTFKLHVDSGTTDIAGYFKSSDNKAAILIADDDTSTYVSAENSKSSIGANPGIHANNLNITSTGSVGIGTTSPTAILDVVGPAARPTSLAEVDTASTARFRSDSSNADSLYIAEASSGALIQVNDGATNSSTAKPLALQPFGGNVGIGTASPQDLLHLSASSPVLRLTNTTDSGKSTIEFWDNQAGTSQSGEIFFEDAGNVFGLQGNANGIYFRASNTFPGTNLMRLDGSGKLGIGTTSPSKRLHIQDSAAHQLQLHGGNSYWNIGTGWSGYYQDYLLFATNTGEKMVIDTNGNIGIGTNGPGVSLDIGSKTDAIRLPNGTTAQRPTAAAGQLRYNTTLGEFEGYDGSAWGKIGGGNAFGTVAVSGQSNLVADQELDTLTLVGQNGITITTNAGSDTVTIDGRTSYSPFTTDLFTAGSSQTAYVLSVTPNSENNLIVFIEGVYQNKNSYTLSGSTLTLDSAPPNGSEVVAHIIGDVVSGVGLNRDNFTGNGSTTAFTLSVNPLHENNTFVYFDGVYQEKSEYSVSGTTLTFTTAPASGDSIEVIMPQATEIQTPSANSINAVGQFDDSSIMPMDITNTTMATTSATTIATHSASVYRTVKYLISMKQGSDYHTTEINLMHDGSTVYMTEYGTLFDNAALGTFDATISSGNILLQLTPGSNSSLTARVVSTAIRV